MSGAVCLGQHNYAYYICRSRNSLVLRHRCGMLMRVITGPATRLSLSRGRDFLTSNSLVVSDYKMHTNDGALALLSTRAGQRLATKGRYCNLCTLLCCQFVMSVHVLMHTEANTNPPYFYSQAKNVHLGICGKVLETCQKM